MSQILNFPFLHPVCVIWEASIFREPWELPLLPRVLFQWVSLMPLYWWDWKISLSKKGRIKLGRTCGILLSPLPSSTYFSLFLNIHLCFSCCSGVDRAAPHTTILCTLQLGICPSLFYESLNSHCPFSHFSLCPTFLQIACTRPSESSPVAYNWACVCEEGSAPLRGRHEVEGQGSPLISLWLCISIRDGEKGRMCSSISNWNSEKPFFSLRIDKKRVWSLYNMTYMEK